MTGYKFKKGKLYDLDLSGVGEYEEQPRQIMEAQAMAELTASVARRGVLQPIIFRVDGEGKIVVVAGSRRVAAARAAGRETIPGLYVSGDFAEIALVENLCRQDLTPVEEAEGIQVVMDQQHYTQEQMATILGKAQNSVSEILSLNRLPREVRDDCRGDRTISRKKLIAIAQKRETHAMVSAYQAHKAKLGNLVLGRALRDHNDPEGVKAYLSRATARIAAIDSSAWSEEERRSFHAALARLRAKIDDQLKPSSSDS